MNTNINIFTKYVLVLAGLIVLSLPFKSSADEGAPAEPVKRQSYIYIRYFLTNNNLPYLQITTKTKGEKGFAVAPNTPVSIYLNGESGDALIGQVKTDFRGLAFFYLPATSAAKWSSGEENTFYAGAKASAEFDEVLESITVMPSKLEIDTSTVDDKKMVSARLMKKEGEAWVPMSEVDLRLAVKRLGGSLNIGESETYTTDSTGSVMGEFQLQNLPGNAEGNIEVVAIVDDNDEVGTLQSGITVPWGVDTHPTTNFGERTLWATGDRAPIWLIVMATGCVLGVWLVVLYLFYGIFKIRKLGMDK